MTGAAFVLVALLALAQDQLSEPPPLTEDQRTRIGQLA